MTRYRRAAAIALTPALVAMFFVFATAELAMAQEPASGSSTSNPSTLDVITDAVKDWLAIVGAVVSIVVVIGGGILARRNAQIFRARSPHIILSHEISHRFVGDSYVHIFVTAVMHNTSRVHIEFLDGFGSIQQVKPVSDDDVEYLYQQVFVDQDFGNLQWAPLDTLRLHWPKDGLLVEPGETETEIFDFVVQRDVRSVAITTYFYNSRVVGKIPDDVKLDAVTRRKKRTLRWRRESGPLGWGRTSVYDIVKPP